MFDLASAPDRLRRVVERIDPNGQLVRFWRPAGGSSAEVLALEIAGADGRLAHWLVRSHGEADRARDPDIAQHEFALLQRLHAFGLAVPEPLSVDASRGVLPEPYLVMALVDGKPEFAPADLASFLEQTATFLVVLHAIESAPLATMLNPVSLPMAVGPLDTTLAEPAIRSALEAAGMPADRNGHRLLHGDYWPGNWLWRAGRLVAVIDWEDAAIGDPLADLANARLELFWWFGEGAMEHFTQRYLALIGIDVAALPFWDLCAALRPCGRLASWGLPPHTERRFRERHARFVASAIEKLAGDTPPP